MNGLITNKNRIAIAGHLHPDGDCTGACIALYYYLKKQNPHAQIDVYFEQDTQLLEQLQFQSYVTKPKQTIPYEIFFALDCAALDRLGPFQSLFTSAQETVNIDHHKSNTGFADQNRVDASASATCEILACLMETEQIDLPIAQALYIGMMHDTGVFQYSNTTKRTMQIAGELIEKGVPFSKWIAESFYQKTFLQSQILGRCLCESRLLFSGKCIIAELSCKTMKLYEANRDDLGGIIDQLKQVKGVEIAVFLYQLSSNAWKVSLRSTGAANVDQIALHFGGGGHQKAAGCTLNGGLLAIQQRLLEEISLELKRIEEPDQ